MTTLWTKTTLALALATTLITVGCGDDDSGSGSGGTGATSGTGGTGGIQPRPPVMCGGTECIPPEGAATYGIVSCCLPDNGCGLETPLAPGDCLPPNQPGGLDPSCADFNMDPITLKGCCAADGQCGGLDVQSLGCIPGDKLDLPAQSCTFQPDNNCTSIIDVVCDGPEDCGSGQQCCGRFAGGSYDRFVCADTCDEVAATIPGTWSEICHPGQTCSVEGYECRSIDYLPPFLYRCRDTGSDLCEPGAPANECVVAVTSGANEISCGDTTCGAGEKCCIRSPRDPYCAPADGFCQCIVEQGTNMDAGDDDGGN